ncbi:antitoxin Xre-like helix-turn-helix domain-containing protein [Pseudomonas sp. BP01]|uniref:antitoxin Xre-like helix-turn-helix domain-containing protein n=1 Tax=Pseudomonas sp. BP01 TaxID=2976152 RepID=UPI001FAA280F|nr:antitoxin Xre-like helix-turn-helix domain-containing protein [Pseudomonas sp. BP01]
MPKQPALSTAKTAVGLKVALRILDGWQATTAQICSILRISYATYRRAVRAPASPRKLDQDQQQRVSLVLNIHASLRSIFENPTNVYGFPGLPNNNAFFESRSPLEVMAQGDMISLYETYKRIQQLELRIEAQS